MDAQPSWRILVHWSTVAAIAVGVSAVLLREAFDGRDLREALLALHRGCGLIVLVLTLARIVAAPWSRHAAGDASKVARWTAHVVHIGLYGLLAGLGFVGWSLASARGQSVALLGAIPLPPLIGRDRDLADSLHEVHEALAYALLAVVVVHVAAALWHHYVRRDGVLRAMSPFRMRRRAS